MIERALSAESKKHAEEATDERCEPRSVVCVTRLSDYFSLSRIRVYGLGERSKPHTRDHGQRNLGDHLTGVARDERCPEDLVGALFHMHLQKTVTFAVEYRAIDVRHLHGECLHFDALVPRLLLVQADVSDFRVGEGTPWNRQGAGLAPPEEECVLYDNAGHEVGRVRELVG